LLNENQALGDKTALCGKETTSWASLDPDASQVPLEEELTPTKMGGYNLFQEM